MNSTSGKNSNYITNPFSFSLNFNEFSKQKFKLVRFPKHAKQSKKKLCQLNSINLSREMGRRNENLRERNVMREEEVILVRRKN